MPLPFATHVSVPTTLLFVCILAAASVTIFMPALSAVRKGVPSDRKLPEIAVKKPPVRLIPTLFISDAEIDARRITDLTVSRTGMIVIADSGRQLIAFTAEGHRAHTIGREGPLPGEYLASQKSLTLDWSGDTLVVRDERLSRVTLFSVATGEYLQSFSFKEWQENPPPARSLTSLSQRVIEMKGTMGRTVQVFVLDGVVPGVFTMPTRDEAVSTVVRNNRLYLVAKDREGYQSIHVYRMVTKEK